MAAQVLSGKNNLSYTNATGQNVRLVINWLKIKETTSGSPTLSFEGTSVSLLANSTYGKTLATYPQGDGAQRPGLSESKLAAIPLEIALANGHTFSINSSAATDIEGYNIIIIPEAG